jgi:protein required for attachment to host cells
MTSEVEPREQERIRFAKLIADRLEAGRVANAFERVILVASPEFLGLLREQLGAPLQSRVTFTLDKDYVTQTPEEIRARLPDRP